MSLPPWRGSARAAVSSQSPVRTSHRTIRPGATLSSGLQERGRVVFSAAIDGAVYAKHGTTIDTRLTVIDKEPAADPKVFPASPGIAPDAARLLAWVNEHVPPRLPLAAPVVVSDTARPAIPRTVRAFAMRPSCGPALPEPEAVELAYETVDWTPPDGARLTDALYEEYGLQSIRISGSQAHPTRLVQSAAMASVAPPKPSYRPHLPANLVADGVLSDAQLESIIYAGEAHGSSSPARGRSMKPSTSSPPRVTTQRTLSAFDADGFSATAPAPARAARSPASCSTTGSRAGAAPSGSASPTS